MSLFDLALEHSRNHVFSTLFTAKTVSEHLTSGENIASAVKWCKDTGVTRVYIESFRDGHFVEKDRLAGLKERFLKEGFDTAGCVTTTRIGKASTGWEVACCFSDIPTCEKLQEIFERTASVFDLIMIDDFLFTDCECDVCVSGRGDRSWAKYRTDLMFALAKDRILGPSRKVNPNVKIIIKYPQWYDLFHVRGYDVARETAEFDHIWTGTETREPDDAKWGRYPQYSAFFIMHWLNRVGGRKNGGGWYDQIGTGALSYVEQGRQTVLGGAKESFLFNYTSLLSGKSLPLVGKLRKEVPEHLALAGLINDREILGVHTPKIPNSDPGADGYIFNYLGMLGIPLVPSDRVETDAASAFFSFHVKKDPEWEKKTVEVILREAPVLLTDTLAADMDPDMLARDNVRILSVNGDPYSVPDLPEGPVREARNMLLVPLGISFQAPSRVTLHPFTGGLTVIENFNDKPAEFTLEGQGMEDMKPVLVIPKEEKPVLEKAGRGVKGTLPPRTLLALSR